MGKKRRKPKEIDWSRQIARAERELEQNRQAIDASPRGLTSGRGSDYRIGMGPGNSKASLGMRIQKDHKPPPKRSHWKEVAAKSDTLCGVCSKPIRKGDKMHWLPITKARKHIDCSGRKLLGEELDRKRRNVERARQPFNGQAQAGPTQESDK